MATCHAVGCLGSLPMGGFMPRGDLHPWIPHIFSQNLHILKSTMIATLPSSSMSKHEINVHLAPHPRAANAIVDMAT